MNIYDLTAALRNLHRSHPGAPVEVYCTDLDTPLRIVRVVHEEMLNATNDPGVVTIEVERTPTVR